MHLRLKKGFSVISEGTEQQIKAKEKKKKTLTFEIRVPYWRNNKEGKEAR